MYSTATVRCVCLSPQVALVCVKIKKTLSGKENKAEARKAVFARGSTWGVCVPPAHFPRFIPAPPRRRRRRESSDSRVWMCGGSRGLGEKDGTAPAGREAPSTTAPGLRYIRRYFITFRIPPAARAVKKIPKNPRMRIWYTRPPRFLPCTRVESERESHDTRSPTGARVAER